MPLGIGHIVGRDELLSNGFWVPTSWYNDPKVHPKANNHYVLVTVQSFKIRQEMDPNNMVLRNAWQCRVAKLQWSPRAKALVCCRTTSLVNPGMNFQIYFTLLRCHPENGKCVVARGTLGIDSHFINFVSSSRDCTKNEWTCFWFLDWGFFYSAGVWLFWS